MPSRPILANTNRPMEASAPMAWRSARNSMATPRYWKIVGGRLYLNLNGDIQAEWSKDIAGDIAKADSNWGRIHGTAVARLYAWTQSSTGSGTNVWSRPCLRSTT